VTTAPRDRQPTVSAPAPNLPLAGTSVVVTRTRAQASELVGRLARLGAAVVELPVIAVEDPADGGAALEEACHRLAAGRFAWVACTSVNAVSRLLTALGDQTVPRSVRWAAVGAGTARALTDGGYPPDLVPAVSVSDALAEEFPGCGPSDAADGVRGPESAGTVLFPRAEVVRGAMAAGLRAKGWSVEEVVAYKTVAGTPDPDAVEAAARSGVVAFTSSSTVTRSLELLGTAGVPPLVVTIGPVTSATAHDAGLEVAAEAIPHTIGGVVDAVVEAVARQRAGTLGPDDHGGERAVRAVRARGDQ